MFENSTAEMADVRGVPSVHNHVLSYSLLAGEMLVAHFTREGLLTSMSFDVPIQAEFLGEPLVAIFAQKAFFSEMTFHVGG